MRLPLPLGRKSNASRAPAESVERLLNCYLESAPDGKEPTPVFGTPGLRLFASGLNGAIRGGLQVAGSLYIVAGTKLYSISAVGVATVLGDIPNADLVSMAGDGTNVVIVTNGKIYVWNQGSGVVLVTDPDAPDASSVVWTDSFFLFGEKNTQQFFISALADPINYDALDFASAEWNPDQLITPLVLHRVVYMLGSESIEAQQDVGGTDFPFARYQDLLITVGVAGREAVVATNDTMFWQAPDNTVRRMDGITATVISTPRISRLIKGWADKSATVASAHVWDNHLFVVFRNPDGCVIFDQSENLWHERGSYGSATWRVRHHFTAFGLEVFGSATEGKLYVLDADVFDEDGAILPFEMVTPFAYAQNRLFTVDEFEVVAQTGVGGASQPQITCERTKDGEVWAQRKMKSLGAAGERNKVIRFGPQGQARQMAFRLRITDAVRRAILGAYAEIDPE